MCCDSFFGVSHVPVLNSTLFITYTIDMRYKIYKCDNVSYADGNARVSMEQVTETPKLSIVMLSNGLEKTVRKLLLTNVICCDNFDRQSTINKYDLQNEKNVNRKN